ncbi:uncharacterized protein LOC133183426 [Saccostrea echinata]|uniref:uncharacterized protein LOC133183426 n=1 Tax=Saccostrea echinata TaxID=191078 RepID=UPI002A7F3C5F|nr:uncharacterized protein LOC133183426 [Saccostrea echinata]
MERDINQYFPPDSIFNDDSELSDLPDDSGSSFRSSAEEKDVYIPRGNISTQVTKLNISKYFSQNSIFLSDDEDDSLETEPVTKRLTPKSPRRNVNLQDLQDFHVSKYSEQKEDPKSPAKTVFSTELEVPKIPTIKIEKTENDFLDQDLYDTPPPPLPNKKRRTLDVSGDEGAMYRQSEGGQYTRRGSCPGFIGTWERDSLLHEKYDNLLANEGLGYSEYEVISNNFFCKSKTRKKTLKEMLLSVFPNRIYLSTSDPEIDNTKAQYKRDSTLSHTSKLHGKRLHHWTVKDKICSKYREIRSAVCAKDGRSSGNLLELESTFCVPAGCSNVSSIIPYDSGQCWVAAEASESILLYDRNGDLMDFVNVGCPVDSLATDKDGNVFMSCPDLKQVRMFDRHRHMRTFLDMTQYPRGIAYMRLEDSILVCRNNNKIANDLTMKACNPLRKYPIRGPKSSKPREKDVAENMFGYPFRVCVNVNDDCIVSDFAHRSITVLDPSGRIRFTFKSSKDFPIRNRHSVCCDLKGNIYIFSKGTPNICVLEPGGNIKDLLSCQDLINESVFASVFDSDDYLWVACMDGFIKIFRKDLNQQNHN